MLLEIVGWTQSLEDVREFGSFPVEDVLDSEPKVQLCNNSGAHVLLQIGPLPERSGPLGISSNADASAFGYCPNML